MHGNEFPQKQGLYDPNLEKDSCGVGFITNIKGVKSHNILKKALQILKNLKHRGAVGAEADTGDGSGIMIQIPDEFFRKEVEKLDIQLPDAGDYAVGMIFLPRAPHIKLFCEGIFEKVLKQENAELLGWREVPVNEKACGESARATRPSIMQVFIGRGNQSKEEFKKKLLMIRKQVQNLIANSGRATVDSFYICSLSDSTITYKGQIFGYKLEDFYLDLQDENTKTAIAIVHERYSTNTFPSWKLAQPFRHIAHNGEINTIRGNINRMNSREGVMYSNKFGEDFKKILPIIEAGGSDSASFDNAFELFTANGHSLEHAMMMLVPEAWEKDSKINDEKRAFYEYHARILEPWDGPSTIAFTDGVKVGVTIDRNGLRPARYVITEDDLFIMASETGVVDVENKSIVKKGMVQSGELILIDTSQKRIISDDEIKSGLYNSKPFLEWVKNNKLMLEDIKAPYEVKKMRSEILSLRRKVFGFTEEEVRDIIAHMASKGEEPIGSMGMDVPLAVLSNRPQLLFNYFKQVFAQVTNPPIDPIREEIIMSLTQYIGKHGLLVDEIETENNRKYIELEHPILSNEQIEDIRHLDTEDFKAITIPIVFEVDRENGLKEALDSLCKRAEESVLKGCSILVLSDRNSNNYYAPIPSLLALGAVHNHLIRKKLRTSADLIVEAGDARDVMHIALLVGYGAKAVNPYMVYELIASMIENKKYIKEVDTAKKGFENYCKAISKGLLKVISRMGISTLNSYNGAQIFQIIGISQDVVNQYFTHTPAVVSAIGIDEIADEVIQRHADVYENIGNIQEKEHSILTPKVVKKLRNLSVNKDYDLYKEFTTEVGEIDEKLITLRGLLKFKESKSISIEEVESIENILKRFTVSGMSFGSLSKEAHETLAIAMNKIGATSNSGEGGEDPERFKLKDNGENPNSAVKQVSSGRFGVTTNYLVNCDELQIKVAQGAKPGEGGHLPGSKVTKEIARVRNSIEGIDLISPPPHHDIYSIEDLAQLIFDLKNVNSRAKIGVKLVAELGIGTVAAGVAKAHADVIMVSGHDGGTGASPLSSMKYVGFPWELGLAEVQQTLLLNNLRSRVTIQADGKLKSGRDIVIAALLGAEQYGFATTALVSLGCIMCRQCSSNRCPVGIATQDTKLRDKFSGRPEHLINYLTFIAEEVREIMSELGIRTMDEMIGRVDLLEIKETNNPKLKNLDLTPLLHKPDLPSRIIGKCTIAQEHKIHDILDRKFIEASKEALENGTKVQLEFKVKNTDRTVGTMISGEIARKYGDKGLPEDTITINLKGSSGQSFGAFAAKGLTLVLQGDANDYVGKGLSGGKIILSPAEESTFNFEENTIAGNTILYGATSGKTFICGKVGQRFSVRNSGAEAVVEGIGDHGCEYMTGGTVVVLGTVGKNFAAGMSGGIAYVLDEDNLFAERCNLETVNIKSVVDSQDIDVLKGLIKEHYLYTNSPKANRILEDWDSYVNKFLKVVSPVYEEQIKLKTK